MNLRIFETVDDLIAAAARTILQQAADGGAIALSGGSTPRPLYELLGRDDALRERRITWVVVDERCVPESDPQSNSAMIGRTLFARGMAPAHRFLRFRTEIGEPRAIADDFEARWKELGVGELDVVLLGMGDDGHTASLFPATTALEVDDRIATEVFVPKLDAWRVTITAPVIRAAKFRMVLTAGESKQETLRRVREGADFPIARVTQGLDDTWWFVDRAAAP